MRNRLKGNSVTSPRFDAGLTITSTRLMFVQPGLPRNMAARNGLSFESFVNPFSPMWMGFADQQVNAIVAYLKTLTGNYRGTPVGASP